MNHVSVKRQLTIAFMLLLVYPSFTEVLQRYLGTGVLRFLPLLAGAALTVVFLIRESQTGQLLLRINHSSEIILWLVILVLAIYRNYDIRYLQNLGGIGIFIVTILLVPVLACRAEWIDTFYYILMAFMAVHVAVTLLCYVFPAIYNNGIGPALNHPFTGDPGYMYGLWANHGYNAFCIAIGLLLFAANAMVSGKKFYIVMSILALFALLLTAKRGPLLFCVGAFLATWALLMRKSGRKIRRIIFLLLGMAVIYVVLAWKFPSALRVFERFSLGSTEDISTGRFDLYQEAIDLFLAHPLLGVGWSGFRFYYSTAVMGYDTFGTFDVHNIYLQVLCETGLVGIIVFLAIAFFSLRNAVYVMLNWGESMGCSRVSAVSAVSIQFFFLMYGLTGNTLYVPTLFVPYIFTCAATYAIRLQSEKKAVKAVGAVRGEASYENCHHNAKRPV